MLEKAGWAFKYIIFQVSTQSDIQKQKARVWTFKKSLHVFSYAARLGTPEWATRDDVRRKGNYQQFDFLNEDTGH